MIIVVAGGTGTAGRAVVAEAARRGHVARAIARTVPVELNSGEFAVADLSTGRGLDAALLGADAVVDCSNRNAPRERVATAFFEQATGNLTAAATRAGVSRYVVLSIIGIERVPTPYYRAKLAHERAARAGFTGAVVIRAAQFHDFADQVLSTLKLGRVALVPDLPVQPVDTSELAALLVDAAEGRTGDEQIAGPRRETVPDMARRSLANPAGGVEPRRTVVVPVPVPGKIGKAYRAGSAFPDPADSPTGGRTGTITFEDYLRDR